MRIRFRFRIQLINFDADPDPDFYLMHQVIKIMLILADPDPQHCLRYLTVLLINCVPVLYRGDTGVNLVVLCGEKPTKSLLERMALSLPAQLAAVAPEEKYEVSRVTRSAADPGCFSRIPDLVFCLSRISDLLDPKTATKERGEKKLAVLPFFVAINITKLEIFYF
jgi:hypothetical protein